MRRLAAAAALLAVLAATSGCVSFVTGDSALRLSASNATVADDALDATGFEQQNARRIEFDRSFEAGGQQRAVNISTHVVTYARELRGAPLAHAVVLSTPEVSVVDQSVNPLARASRTELVSRALDRVTSVQNVTAVSTRNVTTLGGETAVTKYAARSSAGGGDAPAFVYVARVAHDGDLVVFVATHPREMDDGEAEVLRLLRNLEH